jgi:NifU-like protein involved in Fe-S cluster formation
VIYNELTRRYFEAPVCAGRLSGARVFRGAAGDPERGTWVQFEVRVDADRLDAVRFAAFACPHVIAVCAWLAEQAQGTSLAAFQPVAVAQDERFALPVAVTELAGRFAVPVEKMGRLLIIEDAWSAAIAAAAASTSPAVSTVATSTAATTSAIAASTGITTAGATSIDRRAGG